MIAAKRGDFNEISSRFGIDKVTARLIRNRDVVGDEEIEKYLHPSVAGFYSPCLLKDCEKAADIILDKIDCGSRIRIIGDYDIDGIMSTYILVTAFRELGADVDYAIPERIKDGYGLNESLIRDAFASGVDTIVTCDNGIAASEQVRLAKELGMTVIITDHHNVPYEDAGGYRRYIVPEADAVIDPKQEDCGYPYKELCGAGVAWKLVCMLYDMAGYEDEEMYGFLEFAAIATVGDIVDLKDENRLIVKEGLERLHRTEHTGLCALIEKCGIEKKQIDTYHIGFVIGPCLNASGRLDTAEQALRLMCTEEREDALVLAERLRELNEIRKTMTENGVEKAISIIENSDIANDRVLVVYLKDTHESLAGIIAGRLRERYGKPVFVLTDSEEGIKGSGRSTEAYSMYDELVRVGDMLEKYGGHPMAAGLSLKNGRSEELRRRLNELCSLTEDDMEPVIHLDMQLPLAYLREDLINEFELLKPFGKGNEKPLFADKDVEVRDMRIIGRNSNILKMRLKDRYGRETEGICFRNIEKLRERVRKDPVVTIAYYPSVNSYKGVNTIQAVITDCI